MTSRACTARRCAPRAATSDEVGNGVRNDFEAQLFLAADKLRKNLEPSDYKHVVLGLIFLKHISNSFKAKHAALLTESAAARGHKLLPQHMRDALQQLIARDRADTKGATITEIGVHGLDAGEAEFDAERVAIVVLNTGHVRHELRSAPARVLLH